MDLPDSRTLFTIFQVSIAIAIPAFVFFAVTIGRRRDRQRHAALTRIAAELGMHFTPEDYTVLREFGGFPYRPQGDAPRTYSVMRGDSSGVPLLLFDYDVTIGSTNSRSIVRQTVAAFDLSATPLPAFYVEGGMQETVTRLLDRVFGAEQAIEFTDDPEFVRAYKVIGTDGDRLRRVFRPEVRAFLMRRTWKLSSNGRWLTMSWFRERPTVAEFKTFVQQATEGMSLLRG